MKSLVDHAYRKSISRSLTEQCKWDFAHFARLIERFGMPGT